MLDAGPVDEVAAAAEAAGFQGLAFTEHPAPGTRWLDAGGHQTLDPFAALPFAAAATSRIRLLTYLCVLPYRNPLVTAKAAATVDKLSGAGSSSVWARATSRASSERSGPSSTSGTICSTRPSR